jgi:pimeloyl-ACP methyl ester carboxylesterase
MIRSADFGMQYNKIPGKQGLCFFGMGLVRGAFFVGLLVLAFSIRHLFIVEHVVADRIVFFDEKAFFRNPQGLLVHFANLGRELDAPRGVVLFVHGYCEHSGYYSDVATFANDANLAAFGLDHVGHGLSQGERGYIQSIDLLADDVLFFASKLQKKYGVPILLYGHSMGGGDGSVV